MAPVRQLVLGIGAVLLTLQLHITWLLIQQRGVRLAVQQPAAAVDCPQPGQRLCQRLLWFLAIDPVSTDEGSYRLYNAKAALDSALTHAPSLVPVLVYGGKPEDHIAQHFRERGAIVLHHDVDFLPERLRKRRAQYYRLDVPRLAKSLLAISSVGLRNVSTTHLFYTDTDVLIERDISSCTFHSSPILAFTPESRKNHAYNSGVMLMNIDGFLGIYDDLIAYARSANWTFYKGTLQDQGLLNEFMMKRHLSIDLLGNEYNWKGYWGWNPNAAILHFHGLKADICLRTYIKSQHCPTLWRRVCDDLLYHNTHYNLVKQAPDFDMFRHMYTEYLRHLNQTDDLSPSCAVREPLPVGLQLGGIIPSLLKEPPENATLPAATTKS